MKLSNPFNAELKQRLDNAIDESKRILLCTDFDGTLVTFTGLPSETQLPIEMRELLTRLAGLEALHLAIISGRRFQELSELVPVEGVTLAGNHGLKIQFKDGTAYEPEIGEDLKKTIALFNKDIQERFGDKEGIIIENKNFGLALHYRRYDGDEGKIEDEFHEIWKDHNFSALEVIEGAKLLEVRPANWNKGDAIKLLQEKWGGRPTIYLGDDTTDEDAFRVLQGQNLGFPILVSRDENKDTNAQYRLKDPAAVGDFLDDLYRYLTN
ncbi:trehalose-phosphatase [Candidatus Bipolaricaulota bacterium]|nr:trehalose-phosphatase [Candidatus Bipolaricaulota bacterium]